MKFFLDTANVDEIKEAHALGLLDGVTTNPSLVARENKKFFDLVKEITEITDGPVSAEAVSEMAPDMIKEGLEISKIAKNVVIKLPMTPEGLKATKALSSEGIKVNVTLIFQPLQALLAAKAGATYVSPFIGRLDDISKEGMGIISDIVQIFDNYAFPAEVLVASVRHPPHVLDAALIGADVITMPFKVLKMLTNHPLTDKGLAQFLIDWEKVPK